MQKVNTYKIIKINSSRLKQYYSKGEGQYEINLTYSEAVKNAFIVSISESQLTRHLEAMERVDIMRSINTKGKPILDENGKQKEIKFIPDIVLVHFNDETVFTQIKNRGIRKIKESHAFILNGDTYSRLFTPTSDGRKSTSIFISDKIKNELVKKCMNGLILSEIEANAAKFNAYLGLCTSGSREVSTPRACVIKDLKLPIQINTIFITENETKNKCNYKDDYVIDYGENGKGAIREDIKNCFDGMGLIDPAFAKIWARDLNCDYTPCGWVIRNAFLKGAVFSFDFKLWAKTKGLSDITDVFGMTHNVNDIDIILTESQFKMWKQYHESNNNKANTWEFYQNCCKENNNTWAVSNISKKEEKEIGTLNYQFLQTLDLNYDDIISICKPSKDYLDKCIHDSKTAFELIAYNNGGIIPAYAQAVELYPKAIDDPYIASKIIETIKGEIKNMCLGRLRIDGNYQFMINDPVAFCEWVFYQEKSLVKGLLSQNEYYSQYWLDKGIKQVAAIRAPNIHFSEHNILSFVDNENTAFWYKHLPNGIIYNIFGDDFNKHSGNDLDGDIVFTSPSSELLRGTVESPVIYFNRQDAQKKKLSTKDFFEADKIGFKTNIGFTVNLATIAINMLPNYGKESREYKELSRRILILTMLSQLTIDAQKGCEVPKIPEYWHKYQAIKEYDDEKTKEAKTFNNSILLDKKPYFLIYKDENLKQDYKYYRNNLNSLCPAKNPVNEYNSLMNNICRQIEVCSNDSKLKIKSKSTDKAWVSLMKDKNIRRHTKRYKAVENIYNSYAASKQFVFGENYYCNDDMILTYTTIDDCYRLLFSEQVENETELANYLVELLYEKKPKAVKTALWKFAGGGVIKNIEKNLEVKNEQREGIYKGIPKRKCFFATGDKA